jgi:hypothetical protein
MKSIRVQASVVINIDEIMDVEDDLRGAELNKHIFWMCREIAKEYVYDAPIQVERVSLEDSDESVYTVDDLSEILDTV